MTTEHIIDASNRTIGRIASEAAFVIMGKNRSSFVRNVAPTVKVTIINATKTRIPAKKLLEKEYYSFSGYPGGRRSQTLKKVIEGSGLASVFKKAVYGMLPKNKLRKTMLKNLNVTD